MGIDWQSGVGTLELLFYQYFDDDTPLKDTSDWVHGTAKIPAITFITDVISGKAVDFKTLLTGGDLNTRIVASIFCSRFATLLGLTLFADPSTFAPAVHRALRHYGYNTGRYEKYGAI